MNGIVQKWIPKAKILHPWPEERFERYLPKVREPSAVILPAGICAGGCQ